MTSFLSLLFVKLSNNLGSSRRIMCRRLAALKKGEMCEVDFLMRFQHYWLLLEPWFSNDLAQGLAVSFESL